MKTSAIVAVALVASVEGFAPVSEGRASTQLSESLFDKIFGMDLFEPVKTQNDYGARNSKNLKQGKITSSSYVPSGLSAAEYQKFRDAEAAKKKANYERNVKKAGIFTDYTEWYKKRGTDLNMDWKKNKATLGHQMAKTKYDWSGDSDKKLWAKKQ